MVLVHCTALHITATHTNAKFPVNWTRDDKVMLWTKNWIPDAHQSYDMGDPTIHPVFDGCIKRRKK